MSDDLAALLRSIAVSQARLELRLDTIEEQLGEPRGRELTGAEIRLVSALAKFGGGSFTAGTILLSCNGDPHGHLAGAVADVIDMNAAPISRNIQLGKLLSSLARRGAGLRKTGGLRGALMYRLRE